MSWGYPTQKNLEMSAFGPGNSQDCEFFCVCRNFHHLKLSNAKGSWEFQDWGLSNAVIPQIFTSLSFSEASEQGSLVHVNMVWKHSRSGRIREKI